MNTAPDYNRRLIERRVLDLWLDRRDTADIARRVELPESEVERIIHAIADARHKPVRD